MKPIRHFFDEARAEITIDILFIAFFLFFGAYCYGHHDWFGVCLSAFWIMVYWKLLWRDYDEFTNDDLTDDD